MKAFPTGLWLDPVERAWLVEYLLSTGLLRFSDARDLPLKKGGTTDVYINLRDCRSHPGSAELIGKLYADPIRRLGLDRFVEVPDAVSPIASKIAELTSLPYVTIREHPKEGRVAKADMIGEFRWGDRIAILDDVVTDGASKLVPYAKVVKATGIADVPLVVLVDRQQGWRQNFEKNGAKMHVWAGMTLHQVRRQLIEMGAMRRCDLEREAKNPVVVALDGMSWEQILTVVDPLRTTGCVLKVNDQLFQKGMDLIGDLSVYGRVMADFKLHDIATTMGNTAAKLAPFAPWAVTVHASASKEGVAAAVKALEGTATKVLAVTVLTSLKDSCDEIYHRQPLEQVLNLAATASAGGAHGFVCSPQEVGTLKVLYPNATFVVPGVRSPGVDANDQARVDTPANAMQAGATNIVMGRQAFNAPIGPAAEIQRVLKDELGIAL